MASGQVLDKSAAGRLDIRLFGRANASCDGVPVKFAKRATTLAMLALIVLQRGRTISRESLAFTLFPEVEESAALAELRRYLYLASKALPERAGDPWLLVDSETVRWNDAAGAFIDIVEFERLGAEAETQEQAIELYSGDLLEDIYDDWVVVERERLRTRYLAMLNEMLERYRSNREFGAAIACAKRILATDPWREDTIRALLAIRYESGDTAGAVAEYEEFAKRLRDDLAIAPMPETVALRQAILRNEPLPGSREIPLSVVDHEKGRRSISILPFVARKREINALHAIWGRAARGAGTFVLLSGEAGVGKTRLTAELARAAQSEGGRVLVGTTAAPESMPYQAIVEALRSGLPLLLAGPPAPARRAALARMLPELREEGAPNIPIPEQSAELETARIYDAMAHAMRSLASPRPLLVVLEDLHWAGPASIDALGAIFRQLVRAPVLLIATCREEETPADHPLRTLMRSLQVFHNVEEIALDRLGVEDVSELVAHVEGLSGSGESLARDLYAHSEGNALFLNEAISGVLEGGGVLDSAGATSIARVVEARVAYLSEHARAVAEIAAVAGPGCSVSLVRAVANLPITTVASGFDELLDRRILREAGARARYDYVFTHHLIASAVYDAIEPSFRAQRHSRIASILESEYHSKASFPAREIAQHYERGGDIARSAGWYLTAAEQASAVHAYADADDMATRAVDNSSSEDLRRASLEVREKARARRGDRLGQQSDIDELERLAGDDPSRLFDVLVRRVLLSRSTGDSDDEGRYIAQMEAVAQSLGESAQAQALAERATYAGLRSRQSEGIEYALASLNIYERLGDLRGQLECLYLLVNFTANTGDPQASRTYLAAMRERAGTLEDRVVEARALGVAAIAALLRQEYRECFDLTTQALALHLATNDREGEAASRARLAVTAAWLADYGTALHEFERALETYESIGNRRGLAVIHTNRTILLLRLGLFSEALESLEQSNILFDVVHEQRTIVANHVNASFAKLQLGDPKAAKKHAEVALVAAKEIAFPVFEAAALSNLGNAERALGQFEAAIAHMESDIAIRRPIQESRDFVDDLADLTLCYASAGRDQEALATAEELAAIANVSLDGAFWPHYAWWAIAQGFTAGGAHERAREAKARARDELESFAQKIQDERTRKKFLAVPVNVRIAGEA